MTNSKFFIFSVLLTCSGLFGCRENKGIEKRYLMDITMPVKVTFTGMNGEKVNSKVKGTFSGSIKFAMVSTSNKLSDKDFSVFKDSINIDFGMTNIYQDSTGVSWHIRPVDATHGKVILTLTEYRR